MMPKLILVMWMIASRGDIQIQYIARFSTESSCQAEAAKYDQKGWQMYPVQRATCVFDVTQIKESK